MTKKKITETEVPPESTSREKWNEEQRERQKRAEEDLAPPSTQRDLLEDEPEPDTSE